MKDKYSFIFEVSSICKSPADLTIITESYDKSSGIGRLKFKTILQTANEVNSNKRYYSTKICESIINDLKPSIESRSLLQEIDHPMVFSSDANIKQSRAALIEINNAGSLISKIKLDGNNIIAECETLTSFKGPDLYNLIARDKANIGFSVRMFGKLQKHPSIQDVVEVSQPIKAITYDVVSNPSHKTAKILEFIPESFSNFCTNCEITEDINNNLLNDNVRLIGRSYTEDFMISLLKESFNNVGTRLKFKI